MIDRVVVRMRARLWLVLVAVMLLAGGCKEQVVVAPRDVTDDDLRAVTLTAGDLPPGFRLLEEKLTTNEEYAREDYTKNPEKAREVLDSWGRLAGIENAFVPVDGAPERPRQPVIVGAEVHRFSDPDRAHRAMGSHELDEYSDGTAGGVTRLRDPRLGDESIMERGYLDGDGRGMIAYGVTFRKGTVVVQVATAAYPHLDDKGEHAVRLARLLSERAGAKLP